MAGDNLWLVGGRSVRNVSKGTERTGAGWGMALVLYHQGRKRQGPRERASKGERRAGGARQRQRRTSVRSPSHRVTGFPSSIRFRSQADAGTNNSIQLERGILAARRARSRIARQGCWWWWWTAQWCQRSFRWSVRPWMDAALLRCCVWSGNPPVPRPPFAGRVGGEGQKVVFSTVELLAGTRRTSGLDGTQAQPRPKAAGRARRARRHSAMCVLPLPLPLPPSFFCSGQHQRCAVVACESGPRCKCKVGAAHPRPFPSIFRQCQPAPAHSAQGRGVVAFVVPGEQPSPASATFLSS
ncbi:hypothetical protein QBC34DRAFT_56509 [Podospora aff. communis PSN243]|uniref:Uncharacterized protein n=1 Tax=Podospora aff. communis PSN243 TaxID=3040156 RepID=A0AAV9GS27_9PEZI|nr:hypothetical protein QBC34DRAFT_56509 [Podospora aff. communis PSN243]